LSDADPVPQCLPLSGTDPCMSVENGPLIFHSSRRTTQTFSANSDRVRVTTVVRQKRVEKTITDLSSGNRFSLVAGQQFDVLRTRSSNEARLECSMVDGDHRILP